MFKISDKVVCVDDSPGAVTRTRLLAKGRVYVVRGIVIGTRADIAAGRHHGVLLVGLFAGRNPVPGGEIGFVSSRFRLLSEVQEENRLKATAEATT